jgi:hypothetical protein
MHVPIQLLLRTAATADYWIHDDNASTRTGCWDPTAPQWSCVTFQIQRRIAFPLPENGLVAKGAGFLFWTKLEKKSSEVVRS